MECNKDEALRAKQISEQKFLQKDILGAKKFAIKAQTLFPSLEGISQMLSTLDVHLASETRVSGEKDWYAILSVNPLADDETLKKQYRRLALQLHPDKNKSIGAEGAFQLISEAWNILSDKHKRSLYNQTRSIRPVTVKKQTTAGPSNGSNGFYNYAKNAEAKARRPPTQKATPKPPQKPPMPSTFWTACTKCKMQYEYLRIYLGHNLLCPSCKDPFLATEIPKPGTSSDFARAGVNFQWGPFNRTAGVASAGASSAQAAQAANVVHQAYEKVRREREEMQEKLRREREEREREKLRQEKIKRSHHGFSSGNNGSGIGNPIQFNNNNINNYINNNNMQFNNNNNNNNNKRMRGEERNNGGVQSNSTGAGLNKGLGMNLVSFRAAIYKLDTKSILQEKGKVYVVKKLELLDGLDENSKPKKMPKIEPKTHKETENDKENEPKEVRETERENQEDQITMDVPDPEFFDFDNTRTEKSFEPDQIWATYDDEDGMPRYYAFIQKVISINPFKVKMTFLASRSNNEFSDLNWVSHGFAKTCGEFRFGKYETKNSVNMFSHSIKWEKGPKGVVRIFPHKGDIWALYKNWDTNWDKNTPDEVIYKYDMVEILEEYNEGISVAPLVKVNGFKAVFKKDPDPERVIRVAKEEMFRFSHQVPAYRLEGDEVCKSETGTKACDNVDLRGFIELDPAATPLELLQVMNN